MQNLKSPSIIEGYASIFNEPDHQGDVILPGAFNITLDEIQAVPVLWQHHPHVPIGKVVTARQDTYGLWVMLALCTETQIGLEASKLVQQEILSGLSIGFKPISVKRGQAGVRRIVQSLELKEISLVTFPAHGKARIQFNKKSVECL